MELGQQKYGIAGIEKNELWNKIKTYLKSMGFVLRTKTTLIKDFPETIAMVQLQTSYYDPVDYYLNVACIVKSLNNNSSPLFDRDRMNFYRIEDKGSLEECFKDLDYFLEGFSSIEKLKNITLNNKYLYTFSTPQLLKFLGIQTTKDTV